MALLIYRNDACLAVNKLPGEPSEGPYSVSTGEEFLAPAHRLDTPVTGCLLLARSREAAAFLCEAFARPAAVEKRYWAIIEKPPAALPPEKFPPEGELVHWLVENRKANKSFALPFDAASAFNGPFSRGQKSPPAANKSRGAPKKAVMRYRMIGQGDNYLFLEIDLVTGRHHQIRAQLAALGLRVKGDLKYGARRSEKNGGIRLHARSLAFPNPLNPGETIRVKALPPLMDNLWEAYQLAISN